MQLNELTRRLKAVEDKIFKQRDGHGLKLKGVDQDEVVSIVEEHAGPKIKKVEKKMKKYFAERFEDL